MAQVLRQLPRFDDPRLLIGPHKHSDAGAYLVGEGLAILQTVDFFPPVGDDPYVYGQIAAANSLSDVYAMGGRPVTALSVVGFPTDQLPLEVLNRILQGGSEKVREAGAVILGGHSVKDPEIKYGLAVTGVAAPDRIIANHGATPGDVLVLTKPIGTGAMTVAYRRDQIDLGIWDNACRSMARLNRAASQAMLDAGAHGATDITGYGLLGHAGEMADASNVTLEIDPGAVPLLDGALALSAGGFRTSAASSNRDYLGARLEMASGVDPPLLDLLLDAQTSGGLLISLPPSGLETFEGAMRFAAPDIVWARIGRVAEPSDIWARLVALR